MLPCILLASTLAAIQVFALPHPLVRPRQASRFNSLSGRSSADSYQSSGNAAGGGSNTDDNSSSCTSNTDGSGAPGGCLQKNGTGDEEPNSSGSASITASGTFTIQSDDDASEHTKLDVWQPPDGLFFVNVDKMTATMAYVNDGVTVIMEEGKKKLPGAAKPTNIADFQIFYEDAMVEGVALLDKHGVPTQMLDLLACRLHKGKVAKCKLYDYNGSTIASTAKTEITGSHRHVQATVLTESPQFLSSGVVSIQIQAMTADDASPYAAAQGPVSASSVPASAGAGGTPLSTVTPTAANSYSAEAAASVSPAAGGTVSPAAAGSVSPAAGAYASPAADDSVSPSEAGGVSSSD